MDNTKGVYENTLLEFGRSVGCSKLKELIMFKQVDVELKTVCLELARERKDFKQDFLDTCLERAYNSNSQLDKIIEKL